MESKMFVKYGIPGWYIIISLIIALRVFGFDIYEMTGLTTDIFSSVVMTVLGVPIGYSVYQIYFRSIDKKYKNSMPDWNVFMYTSVEYKDREFVSDRYAHMLRSIHEVGVLRVAFIVSFLVVYIPFTYSILTVRIEPISFESMFLLCYTAINGLLLIIVGRNYRFRQGELERYTTGIKNAHLNIE